MTLLENIKELEGGGPVPLRGLPLVTDCGGGWVAVVLDDGYKEFNVNAEGGWRQVWDFLDTLRLPAKRP